MRQYHTTEFKGTPCGLSKLLNDYVSQGFSILNVSTVREVGKRTQTNAQKYLFVIVYYDGVQ